MDRDETNNDTDRCVASPSRAFSDPDQTPSVSLQAPSVGTHPASLGTHPASVVSNYPDQPSNIALADPGQLLNVTSSSGVVMVYTDPDQPSSIAERSSVAVPSSVVFDDPSSTAFADHDQPSNRAAPSRVVFADPDQLSSGAFSDADQPSNVVIGPDQPSSVAFQPSSAYPDPPSSVALASLNVVSAGRDTTLSEPPPPSNVASVRSSASPRSSVVSLYPRLPSGVVSGPRSTSAPPSRVISAYPDPPLRVKFDRPSSKVSTTKDSEGSPITTSHGCIPSILAYKPLAIQPLHHSLAAGVLQGNLAEAFVVVQEMRIRGKGLKWLKDLKESVLRDIVGLWQQGEEKCQDRELKEFGFERPISEEEEVVDPEQQRLNRLVKVGGIKLPGLGISPCDKHKSDS